MAEDRPRIVGGRGSLRGRVLVPLLLAGIGVSVLGALLAAFGLSNHFETQTRARALRVAESVGIAAEMVNEPEELERVVATLGASRDVDRIAVVGGDPPRVLGATRRRWIGRPVDALPDPGMRQLLADALHARVAGDECLAEDGSHAVALPLLVRSQQRSDGSLSRGAVYVDLAADRDLAAVESMAWAATAVATGLVLVLTAVIQVQLRRYVVRPLERIGEALERRGDGETDARAPVERRDEIGALAAALNDMIDRVAESEARLRQVTSVIDDCIWLVENPGNPVFRYVSPGYEKVFGRPLVPGGGQDLAFVEGIHPDDRARVLSLWFSGSMASQEIEFRVVRPDGEVRETRTRIWPVRDARGEFLGMAGVTSDVSEDRRREALAEERAREAREAMETLRAEKDRVRALLQALPDMMFEISDAGRVVACHVASSYEGEFSPEAIVGQRVEDLVSPEVAQRTFDAMEQVRRANRVATYEVTVERADGLRHYESRMSGSGQGTFLVITREVTASRRAAEALRVAYEAAEAASHAKSDFLATMSHEIRTPLNAVIGMTELLLDTDLAGEQREWAQVIRTSGDALLTLINDILDFSKIEAGKFTIEPVEFSPAELLGEVMDLLRERAGRRHDELASAIDPRVPERLLGDASRLRQVLLNLAGNAVKFTENGRVDLSVELCEEMPGAVRLRFAVRDTGPGISLEGQTRLFRAFSQVDASMSRRFGGTGLGLAISKRLVELMGGDIGVESQPGAGSTFWFRLPLPRPKEHAAVAQAEAQVVSGPRRDLDLYVLVAEDNLVNQRLALALLRKLGCRAQAVANGREAVDAVLAGHFDVVLMDCQMPEMDGFEATREIRRREQGRRTPIVAVTANAMQGDRQRCLDAGMQDYVPKPMNRDLLVAALERVRDAARGDG